MFETVCGGGPLRRLPPTSGGRDWLAISDGGKAARAKSPKLFQLSHSIDFLIRFPLAGPAPPHSPSSSNPSLTSSPPPYSLCLCPSQSVWFRHLFLQRVWMFPSPSPPVSWRRNKPRHSSIRLRWMISLSGKWRVIFETLSQQWWRLQRPESEGLSGTKEDSGRFCLLSVFDAVWDWRNWFCVGVSISVVLLSFLPFSDDVIVFHCRICIFWGDFTSPLCFFFREAKVAEQIFLLLRWSSCCLKDRKKSPVPADSCNWQTALSCCRNQKQSYWHTLDYILQ